MPTFILRTTLPAWLLLAGLAPADSNWPRFRGPEATGHSTETGLPVAWDARSILWKTPLKGRGQSSPIIWGDRIFLTSAVDDGKQRLVFGIDRKSGKVLWEQVAWTGTPEPTHVMNGWASATCVTDGQHVYASFGKAGLHCYTVDGRHVWSRHLGEFISKTKRGTAASPILAGDLVIFNGDSESDPYLFGIDKRTGQTVWKTERPAREGYSTPLVVTVNGRQELVLNGDPFVAGYDPATGKQLWFCKSFAPRGEPAPTIANGILYVINGQPGDVYAVRPGGSGDVTKTHIVWHTPRKGGRDQPCPTVAGNYLLVPNLEGILTCYDVKTGKELWKERISTARTSASPVVVEGRVYFINEKGEVIVVEPGPELKVVARNNVDPGPDEVFRSQLAPSSGVFFLRSDRVLYCVGGKR